VADAHQRLFKQPDNRGQHLIFRQTRFRQILSHSRMNPRKHPAEVGHPIKLGLIANFTPSRMVSILLAAASVTADGLEMAFLEGANPDFNPGGWNDQRPDAGEGLTIPDRAAVRAQISKNLAGAGTSYSRRTVGN